MTQNRRQVIEQLWQRITGLSIASRVLIVLLLTIAGLCVVNYSQGIQPVTTCKLFGECQLTPAELSQIELALHKSGKHDFQIANNSVFVAASLRDEYLDALEKEKALPVRKTNQLTQDSISPFLSPSQQAEMRQARKNAKIEKAICHLPYVEQAWFEIDIAPGETAFQPDRRTAIIEVQTTATESLDSFRIQMIRRIISGYVAAIDDPNQIVVADLRAGLAFKGAEDGSLRNVGWTMQAADRQSTLERKIAAAINGYEGVSFKLDYKLLPKHIIRKNQTNKLAAFRKPVTTELDPDPNENLVHYGANEKITIETSETNEKDNAPLAFAPAADQDWERYQEQVAVVVKIDDSAILSPHDKTLRSQNTEELRSRLVQIQGEIKNLIQPVLPISALNSGTGVPIRFELPNITKLAEQQSVAPFDLSRIKFAPTLTVLCLGGVLLVLASRKSGQIESVEPQLAVESATTPPRERERRKSAEERLSQLIETDPEAAAQVLKGWIKDAA